MNGPTLLSLTHELNRCREEQTALQDRLWATERALRDALDVAIWLTGVGDLSEVEGWPRQREKLREAILVARQRVSRPASEQEETDG